MDESMWSERISVGRIETKWRMLTFWYIFVIPYETSLLHEYVAQLVTVLHVADRYFPHIAVYLADQEHQLLVLWLYLSLIFAYVRITLWLNSRNLAWTWACPWTCVPFWLITPVLGVLGAEVVLLAFGPIIIIVLVVVLFRFGVRLFGLFPWPWVTQIWVIEVVLPVIVVSVYSLIVWLVVVVVLLLFVKLIPVLIGSMLVIIIIVLIIIIIVIVIVVIVVLPMRIGILILIFKLISACMPMLVIVRLIVSMLLLIQVMVIGLILVEVVEPITIVGWWTVWLVWRTILVVVTWLFLRWVHWRKWYWALLWSNLTFSWSWCSPGLLPILLVLDLPLAVYIK